MSGPGTPSRTEALGESEVTVEVMGTFRVGYWDGKVPFLILGEKPEKGSETRLPHR